MRWCESREFMKQIYNSVGESVKSEQKKKNRREPERHKKLHIFFRWFDVTFCFPLTLHAKCFPLIFCKYWTFCDSFFSWNRKKAQFNESKSIHTKTEWKAKIKITRNKVLSIANYLFKLEKHWFRCECAKKKRKMKKQRIRAQQT